MLCKQVGKEVFTQICRKGGGNEAQCGPIGTMNSKIPLFMASILLLEIEMRENFALFRAIFLFTVPVGPDRAPSLVTNNLCI